MLHGRQDEAALEMLNEALLYPKNFGEGKLAGAQENNIHYYLECVYERLGLTEKATEYFQAAMHRLEEPAGVMFYNDQPPDIIFYQGVPADETTA